MHFACYYQSKHMDEPPNYVTTFMQQPGRTVVDMPLSVLVALEAAGSGGGRMVRRA